MWLNLIVIVWFLFCLGDWLRVIRLNMPIKSNWTWLWPSDLIYLLLVDQSKVIRLGTIGWVDLIWTIQGHLQLIVAIWVVCVCVYLFIFKAINLDQLGWIGQLDLIWPVQGWLDLIMAKETMFHQILGHRNIVNYWTLILQCGLA
jgi:hypothetical protein